MLTGVYPISIMQGRLSPSENERFQFFPNDWPVEFKTAKEVGFDGICWFLDVDKNNFNPIKDVWENPEILEQIDEATKILPLRGLDTGRSDSFETILSTLAPRLTGKTLSIPLLEDKFPRSDKAVRQTADHLRRIADLAQELKLRLALETEWTSDMAIGFLEQISRDNVGICYDVGNATSYGFNCPMEIKQLGDKIFDVHIKDRKKGGAQSMLLGEGDADFGGCFKALKQIDYKGGFTMQAWRGENYIEDAKTQLAFVKKCLSSL